MESETTMKTVRATLLSTIMLMLALSLLAPVTMAQKTDPADLYADSDSGTVSSDVIKSLKDCPLGTDAFFKNVNPFISGGSGENGWLEFQETFLVDGSEVKLTVYWKDDDNSFRFAFDPAFPGIMYALGAEIGNDKLIYTYPTPVFADGGLDPDSKNLAVLKDGSAAADVNHLDLCMSLVDSTGPTIEFISPPTPEPGDNVSGTVTVQVRVTDESGVGSVSAVVYPTGDPDSATPLELVLPQEGDIYTWVWTTFDPLADPPVDFASGSYTIAVTATDLAIPATNTRTVDVTIELVESFTGCFGTLEEGDFTGDPEPTTGFTGCDPTAVVNIQAPPENSACTGPNPPDGCYISGTLLKPANPTAHCGVYGFPDPRMAPIEGPSPEYPVGRWVPTTKSSLNIFTEVGVHPDQLASVLAAVQASYPPGFTPPQDLNKALVLDDKTYCANGCCVIAQHLKGNFLDELYLAWPDVNGLAFIKTHNARFLLGDDLAAKCYDYDPDGAPLASFDLQDAASVGYMPLFQTADDSGFLTVLTQDCRNPARDLTRNNGFDVSNIIVSTAMPRIFVEDEPSAVLQFMFDQSEQDFLRALFLLSVILPPEDGGEVLVLTGNFNRDVASPINQAKARFGNFNVTSLQQSIDALIEAADGIRTKTTYKVIEENPPGELLALVEHLIWELGLLRKELIRVEALP
jgi:hypothetical protein